MPKPHVAYGPEHLASPGQRFSGRLLDNIVFALPLLFTAYAAFSSHDGNVTAAVFVVALAGYLGVQGWAMKSWGQTLGKRVARTRVVSLDGSPVGFFRGFLMRDVIIFIAGVTRIVGLINALMVFNSSRRCGHDHILVTVVVDADAFAARRDDPELIAEVFR
jgi:uncharacterized RDD family membrane protein YckC